MIIEAQRQRSSLDTPGGYRGRLNKISPAQGQAKALRAQLDALIQSNTPQVVKDAIASGLIGNYGGVDQDVWNQYYQNAQQKVITPQTPTPAPRITKQAEVDGPATSLSSGLSKGRVAARLAP